MPDTSLDELFSLRQFSVKSTSGGDALTKIFKAPSSWSAEKRMARFVMTAQIKDRYGDIVITKGGDLTEFNTNPVCLWAHNSRAFPIGMWANIQTIGGKAPRMEGDASFGPPDVDESTDKAVALVGAGMLRACSIGFMPKEWEAIDKENPWAGYKFLEWDLLECSVCSIPANPAALVKAAGGDQNLALQAIELVLDEWARTPDGLIVPRQKYIETHTIVRNKDVTIHEVKSVDEPDVADEPAAIVDTDKLVKSVTEGVVERLKAILGLTTKTVEPEPVKDDPVLTPETVIDLNVAAEQDAAAAAAAQAEAEQKRLADEAAEAQKLADAEAEQRLRARAILLTS